MAKKITVLLVDDHSLVRRGFRRMLEDDPDMRRRRRSQRRRRSRSSWRSELRPQGGRHGLRLARA